MDNSSMLLYRFMQKIEFLLHLSSAMKYLQ